MKKSALSNEAARQAQERTSPWKRPRLWRELAVIFLGSLLFAASMNCIVLPTGMYSGGFLGLAQLLRMGLESLVPGLQSLGDLAGAIYFLLNLPLLAIAWSRFGHYFLGKTIACVLFYSVLLAVIPIPEVGVFDEVLTACVIGGLLCGAGAGLTLTAGCSGGGEEILGLLCAMKNPWFSVGRISMLLNIGVFGTGLFLFDRQSVVYSILMAGVMYLCLDRVHLQNVMVAMFIITKREDMEKLVFQRAAGWGRALTAARRRTFCSRWSRKRRPCPCAGPFRSGTPTYLPSFVRTFPWWGISRNGYRGGRRRWEESSGSFCSWDAACWPAVSRQRRFRCRRWWDAIQWRDMRRTRRTWRRPPIPIPAAPRAFQ